MAAIRPRGPRARAPISRSINENNDGTISPRSKQAEHDGLEDENDVPGIPLLGKRPERAHAVIVGEVEQNVAETGEAGIEKEQSPARRKVGIFYLASAQTPNQIDEAEHHRGVDRNSKKRVRESTMMRKAERRAAESAENVEIRSLCRQRQRELWPAQSCG